MILDEIFNNACMFELTQPVGKASREPLPGSGGASLLMFTRETNTYLQMVIINNKIGKRPQQQFGKSRIPFWKY